MFKGSKEHVEAANTFFNQQDKNKDGHLDRVSFPLAPVTELKYKNVMTYTGDMT